LVYKENMHKVTKLQNFLNFLKVLVVI